MSVRSKLKRFIRKNCSNYLKKNKTYKCLGVDLLNEGYWREPEEECLVIEKQQRCPFFERFLLNKKNANITQAYEEFLKENK